MLSDRLASWRPVLEAYRCAEAQLMAATSREGVATAILPHAARLVGGGSAVMVDDEGAILASHGPDAPALVAAVPAEPPRSGEPPLEVGTRLLALPLGSGWLVTEREMPSESGGDDLELLESFGRVVDLALERASLFDHLATTCEQLCEQERQLAEAQRLAKVGSFEWDPSTSTTTWSAELRRMFGVPPGERPSTELIDRVHPEDRGRVLRAHLRMVDFAELQYRIVLPDGQVRSCRSSGRRVTRDDGSVRFVGIIQDVTDLKLAEEQVRHHGLHDSLTDLPNRFLLMDRIEQALARRAQSGRRPALLFLDVDRFKSVNDAFGHGSGDEVLREVARRLGDLVPRGDTVARLGGDEFVVLLEQAGDARQTLHFAERMLRAVAQPIPIDGGEVRVTCSIGVAVAEEHVDDAEAMLRDSDMAMYRAKETGRDRVELFDTALRLRVLGQIEMEGELRHALSHDELILRFQPCTSIASGAVVGLEALVRWQHPTRGLVLPAEFIPMAEATGLVVELGRTVLRSACRIGAELHARHGRAMPTIWVNVSARQLQRPGLAQIVAAALEDSGLPGRHLGLELTETALMENTAIAGTELEAVRGLGVHLALDDFGTGFSSLSYLRKFPVDLLKIDGSFVAGLGVDPEDTAIVNACVALAHSLGLPAVAEGVETVNQLDALRLIGCDRAQGFLLSLPVSSGEVSALIDASRCPVTTDGPPAVPRRPRVMVCDDDASVRLLLRIGLEGEGAEVVEASGAEDCVTRAPAVAPDLVLLDVRMPGRDGLWALEQLHRSMPGIPVMLVTAASDEAVSEQGRRLGAAGCLDKMGVLDRLPDLLDALRAPA